MLTVNVMEDCGFCDGVRHAVESAERQRENILAGKKVFLYGNLVNNAHVMRRFSDMGFGFIDPGKPGEMDRIDEGSIVVIRAHGIPREVEEGLAAKNLAIEDCTCGRVKKIHRIVSQKSREGYKIVIIGSGEHPEVTGTAGWCLTPAHIASSAADLEGVDLSGKLCVVAQTTCEPGVWDEVSAFILAQNPAAEIHNTLCGVIGQREEAAGALAASVEVMVVAGDSESSNSKRLYRRCKAANPNTFPVSSVKSLIELENSLQGQVSFGLAAGASVPDETIHELRDYLLFKGFFAEAKKEIEEASNQYFDSYRPEADSPLVHSALCALRGQNEGGKRIRGAMAKLGERIAAPLSGGGKYLPLAVGYELFQSAVLIHDDIIDKSDTRRNKPTIHAASAKSIKSTKGISEQKAGHYGMSRALCIGDYGFFISYQFLSKCDIESSVLAKVYELYSKVLAVTCEGEIMDSMLPYERISIADDYETYRRTVEQIYECKTAWYTLAGPLMLGALCGGAGSELLELLKNIAIPLGIAFQIKDDLLGIYSSEEALGKSVLSDAREAKQTLLYGYAYKNADGEKRRLLDLHYGKEDADEADLEVIKAIFDGTGAKKHAEDEIKRLSDLSRAQINSDLIDGGCQSILNGLVGYLTERNY